MLLWRNCGKYKYKYKYKYKSYLVFINIARWYRGTEKYSFARELL